MPSVLFVCTANRFRSPLAAAWFQRQLKQEAAGQDWSVDSAGTWAEPGQHVIPSVSWARDEFGIDLASHRSKPITGNLLASHDLILVMENNQREALLTEFPETKGYLFRLAEVAVGLAYDVPDPGSSTGESFEDIATELHGLIKKGCGNICRLASQLHKIDMM